MKLYVVIAALFAAAVTSAQDVPMIEACNGNSPVQLELEQFSVSPFPMCAGKDLCITATGNLSKPITNGARLSAKGYYLKRVFYTYSGDLCELMAAQGHPCPIPTSDTSFTACFKVKETFPPGIPIELHLAATNGDGNLLFCQKILKIWADSPSKC